MLIRGIAVLVLVLAQQLPAPFHTPWFRRGTRVVAMPEGHRLTVPPGFTVSVFADGLQFARFMALAPNGDVFLAEPVRGAGKITILRDADADGVAETRETFATGLNRPFGLAFWKNYLYVGNNDSVVRFTYERGQTKAIGEPERIAELPSSDAALDQDTATRLNIPLNQTRGYNHWTRNVIFNPDGTKLYVTIGSATNATPEPLDTARAGPVGWRDARGDPRIQPRRLRPARVRGRTSKSGWARLFSGHEHALDFRQRTRSPGR